MKPDIVIVLFKDRKTKCHIYDKDIVSASNANYRKDLYQNFIDYTKAFGRVRQEEKTDMHEKSIRL